MSIFGKSSEELRRERDELQELISTRAMELAGRMATMEETHRELIPLTTRAIALENTLFSKTSASKLRREKSELELKLDQLRSQYALLDSSGASLQTRQRLVRAEMMQVENNISKLDQHLAHRPAEASVKNVIVLFGFSALAVLVVELLKSWL